MADERIKKSPGDDKAERAMEDRAVTENRELSDADRLELFRSTLNQSHLPNLPPIPGYHVCWLTTTNPRDSIQRRLMLGYELIQSKDVPGFELTSVKSGDFTGYIGVNEMVAAKLPESLYRLYMTESHHVAPNKEEERMNATVDTIREEAAKRNLKVKEGEETEQAW